FQHLRGRGLLLQRLGKLARARLHLIEQPHVLDRDHRLVGEGLDQLDLLIGERPHACALQVKDTDWYPLPHERHSQHSMDTTEPGALKECVFGISLNICDLNRPALKHGAADDGTATYFDWMIPHEPLNLGRMTEICDLTIHAALLTIDRSHVRV